MDDRRTGARGPLARLALVMLLASAALTGAAAQSGALPSGATQPGAPHSTATLQRSAALGEARFLVAALLLQSSMAGSRPWLREYEMLVALAPKGVIARPLEEVLASHAARGIASTAELGDRFVQLAAALVARAPDERGFGPRAAELARSTFAAIGLATPPAPSATETITARICEQLRRGDLASAVNDAQAIDRSLQPLIAGWLAQAEARLAAEHAVREIVLHALAGAQPSS